jgi:transcription termination/antitermination protein NusG
MAEETKWYSLRVISGKERAIKERIEKEIKIEGWEEYVTNVVVPTEKVYKIRNGKKVIQERNIMPGYILIEALPSKLRGDVVTQISNVQNVIHFLGKNEPIPMQTHEAKRVLGVVDDTQGTTETLSEPFLVGESVKITEGAFADFVGEVLAIDEEKKKLKVVVKIFGRGTEMELSFLQVEKQ